MQNVIQLDHVTKRYGNQIALDGVSFEVPPGVVFGLLGENGAGKTTAIRILLGLAEPDRGQAHVFGLDSQSSGLEIRRRVGYVPERPTLYEWMRVGEIGWFTAGFYGHGFLPRYQELVRRYGLDEKKKLKALSKGMRAKVALALAMAHDPELLVLDEPTSGLDTLVRREFLESMVDRAAAGYTVFLSSHQIAEVERVADIVAIMRRGRLAMVESLEKLKATTLELTITLADSAPAPPPIAGQILRQEQRGRQWQFLVRGVAPQLVDRLRGESSVQHVDARTPDLEEIFVAYMLLEGEDITAETPPPPPAGKTNRVESPTP